MLENIILSLQSIWAHKLRSILTMLGVIIGIAAIIAIFSIIEGNTANMKRQFVGGNNNTIEVEYGKKSRFNGSGSSEGSNEKKPTYVPILSQEQMNNIKEQTGIKNIAPLYQKNTKIYQGQKSSNSMITATTQNYFEMNKKKVVEGRLFTEVDYTGSQQSIIMNKKAYDANFPKGKGVGKYVEINGYPFQVIGVYEDELVEGDMSMDFGGQNESIVPLSQWDKITSELNPEPKIIFQTETTDQLKTKSPGVASLLNTLVPESGYVFGVKDAENMQKQLEQINRSNFLLLAGIASISLVVGGIGVMNIMLVSVTERTREIGVKKALGARRKVILEQFLVESVTLTIFGGILGIIVGVIIGKVVTSILYYPFIVSIVSVVGSIGFCSLIGIIFGLMPAVKASKLDPIEALRYE
ncbi:putative ABC transport system permease protein [Enterococcus rotai]|uniref:ABC transporter permease n=1 Tax=Enterococcus rotai TaxID=118060 RepID=A0A0U2VU00_9ENTE|nr:ABC transporter permease [Enterococcus rotai]ALS36772.1 ABC transporter permease [Enterococcus rotai]